MGSMTFRGGPNEAELQAGVLEAKGATNISYSTGDDVVTLRWDAGQVLDNPQTQPVEEPLEETTD